MKMIRNILLIGLAALAVATTRAQDNDAVKNDMAQLQGEWTMISGERDGHAFSAQFMKDSKRSAKGDETTVMLQGQLFMRARFTLDPSKTPKTIDYSVTGGPNAGKTQLGIYELDGDRVKFCFSTPGKERPLDFTAKPNDGRTLSVWKQEKKKEPHQ
jgi:uncharacterized protein (TIGR03067 family)